jgi:hypothetical protein
VSKADRCEERAEAVWKLQANSWQGWKWIICDIFERRQMQGQWLERLKDAQKAKKQRGET